MPERFTPIQHKLRRVILLTCGLVLLLTCTVLSVYEFLTYRSLAQRELGALGRLLSVNSTAALAARDQQAAQAVLRSLHSQRNLVEARLYDAKGRLFAHYPADHAVDIRFIANPPAEQYRSGPLSVEGYLPVAGGGQRNGTLYLRTHLQPVYERLARYLLVTLLVSAVAVRLAVLYSRRLQRSVSVPILQLAGTARAVSERRDYSVRATAHSGDEIGLLTDAFNGMLAQIERQNEEIRSLNRNLEQKVTERTAQLEAANATLRAQKELTENIIDSSVDLIAVLDSEGRYVSVNRQCELVFGKGRDALIGRRLDELFPGMKGDRVLALLDAALQGRLLREESHRSALSGHYYEHFYIPLHNDAGAVDRVLLVSHDITGIMESNARLTALNRALGQSNRELEQFAYIASHDLQEPLRKLVTFADLSKRHLHEPPLLEGYLQKIIASAGRMSALIRDVLQYSQVSGSGAECCAVDLNEVLAHIREDLELLLQEKGALLTAMPLPVVIGNRLQLGQLFSNLISNALKFSEEAPRVSIAAITHGADAVPAGGLEAGTRYVELVFTDNGIGFEPSFADKIFSLFQRLPHGADYPGTGVGLALCKKIVDYHHGAITVESTPGRGTRFHVFLPLPSLGPVPSLQAPVITLQAADGRL
ncbi:ATP-binding protein [Flaviaesturariibacter amylovorans]|uniref:histidine kinase n=1 Tax=Flaviaesturariibacter amylovorans TaxID=1084520 RepID=A0ABP8HB47_9BACT